MAIIFTPNKLFIGGMELPAAWGNIGSFSGLFATRASIENDFRFSSVELEDFGDARSKFSG